MSTAPDARLHPPRRSVGCRLVLAAVAVCAIAWPVDSVRANEDDDWTTDVESDEVMPAPGEIVTFDLAVTTETTGSALVDLEVFDASGTKVAQWFWPAQAFTAGVERRYEQRWTVPADAHGRFDVRVGVFSPQWDTLYHWNHDALTLIVKPTTTTSPPPTTTSPPPTTTSPPPTTTTPATTTTTTTPTTTTTTTTHTTTTAPPTPTTTTPTTTTTTPTTTTTTTTTTLPPASPPGAAFVARFETAADFYERFQLDVHFRDAQAVDWGRTFSGDHDMSCGSPTTQRDVRLQPDVDGANRDLRQSELFWWCAPGGDASKGHIMTGMADVDGYTILSFAPNRSFTNVSQVCWSVNLTDLGGRKWTQVVIVPEAEYQRNGGRLDYISPVTEGVDPTALPLPSGAFMFQLWDHAFRMFNPAEVYVEDGANGFSTTDKARRYRHCIVDNGDGTITVSQERNDGVRQRTVPGSLPDQARVIFQDDNYTPEKDGPIAGFTWHWDDIEIT